MVLATKQLISSGVGITETLEREVVNHIKLQHPNIIAFKEVSFTTCNLVIVMEFASAGSLLQKVEAPGRIDESMAHYYFRQLVDGLTHCHDQSITHRDIKLDNLLLDGPAPHVLKLCDFGWSKTASGTEARSEVGTYDYMAPEVLQFGPELHTYDGKKADVWSCGVILYVMLFKRFPFERELREANLEQLMKGRYCSFPEGQKPSKDCQNFLHGILAAVNPANRPSLAEVREHPWFKSGLSDHIKSASGVASGAPPFIKQSEDNVRLVLDGARDQLEAVRNTMHKASDAE